MKKYSGIVPAILLGCAAAIIPTLLQPHFKAGSFPDFVCELFLLPGKLIASLIGAQFPVRGTASPEFLWWSRLATVIAFAALTYAVLRYRTDCGNVMYSFVAKSTLAITGCGKVSVIATDGHVLFSDVFNDAYLHFGGASRNGKTFVIAVSSWHPGDPPYLTDEWLVVYDVDRRGPIAAFKAAPLPYQQSQSALSENGDQVLIGTGEHVKLIELPR